MRSKTTRSSVLIIAVVCLMVLLSSGGIYTIYLTHTIRSDAQIINKLGIIRGSLQRLVKLEAQGTARDDIIGEIDSRIQEFNENKIVVYDDDHEIDQALDNLSLSWLQLKQMIYAYRSNPSEDIRQAIIDKSEEVWEKSNSMVLISQIVSERKLINYQISNAFFAMNLVLGLLIILLIKKYVKDKLEHLVNRDEMTNVYNRRHFNEYLKLEISKSQRYAKPLSLIMYDIDYFKRVNDRLGHDVGDYVLLELTNLVGANIRKSDLLFRIGGEEFAILIPESIDVAFES
ncbi:sensor domain-containing diguanylate cyclase [Desulfitobacterium dichloroeliminans]|uniref:sensor domain-containing diguanylate cyclase n=1 Tax=Desulfitobacterium dichloroeliminans TaxID=233055 RepID=UPI000249729F|nr:GGDEF domain-containing protein [Desulfitobacterium dichloroeliminans]